MYSDSFSDKIAVSTVNGNILKLEENLRPVVHAGIRPIHKILSKPIAIANVQLIQASVQDIIQVVEGFFVLVSTQ